MKRFKYVLLILLCTALWGCKKENDNTVLEQQNLPSIGKCNISNAEHAILKLSEIIDKNKFIDSLTSHKHGISLSSDSIEIGGTKYYEIKAGYNSEIRFETYFTFYVEKENCNNIKVWEPIQGNIITLSEWRDSKKEKYNDELIICKEQIKNIVLPFSFNEYSKDQYSDEKYPNYQISQKMIDFLVSKDYEGEKYKCFVIKPQNTCSIFVISVLRGDSEYFVLLTTSNNSIVDFKEIGVIGNSNPITFKIKPNLIVEKFNGNNDDNVLIEKISIDNECKISNVENINK